MKAPYVQPELLGGEIDRQVSALQWSEHLIDGLLGAVIPSPRRALGLVILTAVLVAAAGCSSESLAPTLEDVAGTYVATVLLGPGDEDLIAEGASLTLVLDADGSVAGSFFVPASFGGPHTVDMTGTFALSGNTVTFSQPADSFVRDVDWIWDGDNLEASWETGVGDAFARLERQ